MNIYQEVQTNFESVGFSPKLSPFNHKTLGFLVTTSFMIILGLIFLIHEADSAQLYMESIYSLTACIGVFLSFANLIFITKKLFSFIESMDKIINESK